MVEANFLNKSSHIKGAFNHHYSTSAHNGTAVHFKKKSGLLSEILLSEN